MADPTLRDRFMADIARQPSLRAVALTLRLLFGDKPVRFVGSFDLSGMTLLRVAELKDHPEWAQLKFHAPSFLGYHGFLPFYFDDLAHVYGLEHLTPQERLALEDDEVGAPKDAGRVRLKLIESARTSLRDFLDLLLDPLINLQLDACVEASIPVAYERARAQGKLDRYSVYLLQCLGLFPLPGIDPRTFALAPTEFLLDPDTIVGYAGLLAVQPPCAAALRALIHSYFVVPVVVEQADPVPEDADAPLRFSLRLGPLPWRTYRRFLPDGGGVRVHGDWFRPLAVLTRLYVGVEYQFDVQLVLDWAPAAPRCTLDDPNTAVLDWALVLDSDDRPPQSPVGVLGDDLFEQVQGSETVGAHSFLSDSGGDMQGVDPFGWQLFLGGAAAALPVELLAFQGQEELSRPFQYQLELRPLGPLTGAAGAVGQLLTFGIRAPNGQTATWHGVIARLVVDSVRDHCRMVVEPRLVGLSQRADCRIFHQKTVRQIVEAVLEGAGFDPAQDMKWMLSSEYRKWKTCVQYRESDLQFVGRLLEHEGIFYYHTHSATNHCLVLSDDNNRGRVLGPLSQAHNGQRGMVDEWQVTYSRGVQSYSLADFHTLTPGIPMDARAGEGRSLYHDYPGEYDTAAQGQEYAARRLAGSAVGEQIFSGRSTVLTVQPGSTFDLDPDPGGKGYLLTKVAHRAQSSADPDEIYWNTFECVPKAVPYRPTKGTPRPRIHSLQPAWVVDVDGNEQAAQQQAHTYPDPDPDGRGRVRVRFVWKPLAAGEGKKLEAGASDSLCCWLPVATPWAGQGYGMMFPVRIGQLVLVAFSEGIPERGVVVGSLFPSPDAMPLDPIADAASALIKSRPVPEGDPHQGNQIRWNDTKAAEEFNIKAERLLTIRANQDVIEDVGGNREQVIRKDEIRLVQGNLSLQVSKSHQESIGGQFLVEAGEQIHLKSSQALVLSADQRISLIVGGNYVDITAAGVAVNGTLISLNCGGAAPAPGANVAVATPRELVQNPAG